MGTQVEVLIPKDEHFHEQRAEAMAKEVFSRFRFLEKVFSRFDPGSELSHLNASGEMEVSELFWDILDYALALALDTEGIFNPLVRLDVKGYSMDFHSGEIKEEKAEVSLDYSRIERDRKKKKVILPENAHLDLGGCVKGFAVDEAVSLLDGHFPDFLVNAGGDLYARGLFHGKPWTIGAENPVAQSTNIDVFHLSNGALASSGSYRRHWEMNGKSYHHIVSGKTNENVPTDLIMVSVQAKTTMDADAFATIAFLLGEEEGNDFLARHNATGRFFYTSDAAGALIALSSPTP